MYATHLSNKRNLKHLNFGSVTAVFDWKQAEATIMPGAHYWALNFKSGLKPQYCFVIR